LKHVVSPAANFMPWLIPVTRLGDAAVLLPLIALMLFWLVLLRSQRTAAWWVISVFLCAILTGMIKLGFYGCPGVLDLNNPSGHTSFSTLVYGAISLVSATEASGLFRLVTISGGAGFIIAIAASRLLLHVHSIVEVGLGIAIGTLALVLFARSYLKYRSQDISPIPLFLICGTLVFAMYGRRIIDMDTLLRHMAGYFHYYCT
jgi:membrane-associated phospholipid phosphatase